MPSMSASCLRDSPRSARSTASRLWTGRWWSGIGGVVGLDPGGDERGRRREVHDHPQGGGPEGAGVEPQGVAAGGEVDLGDGGGGDQDGRQDAVRQGVGLLAQGEVALVEPGAAAVDAPAGIAVADGQGGQGGQQGQQEEGQDEPPVQGGVLEGGEDGYGHGVAGQGNGDYCAAP